MKIELEYPYDDYAGYLVTNPENRRNVCLIHKATRHRTTVSYARYLMSVKERRILSCDEQVDHKDGDKTNDTIENLQIISRADNIRKSFIEKGRTRKMAKMSCPNCRKIFIRPISLTYLQKGGHYTSCSRQCSYDILKKGLSIKELKQLGSDQIIEYFRK